MKNPKIIYKIQRLGIENPLEITIGIEDVEWSGLAGYLVDNRLISNIDEKFEILSRYVVLAKKETGQENFNKVGTNRNYQKHGFQDKSENFPIKRFRVDLHSNYAFKNTPGIPRFVDVASTTKGRALMKAMNKVGYTEFPDGWREIEVILGNGIEDWGIHSLGDENNPYVRKKEANKEENYAS